jgi:hypothetical protein
MGEEFGMYGVRIGAKSGDLLERDRFEDLGVDGRKVLAVGQGGMDRIAVAQDRDSCRALVIAVMEFSSPTKFVEFLD